MATLYLIATPIGNLGDVTLRSLQLLDELAHLACEDPRITRRIFQRHEISTERHFFTYHEEGRGRGGDKALDLLDNGADVGLCSCAGLPGVSDPGYRIISEAIARGHDLDVIPGPSAVQTALLLSGLPTSSYTFKGFAPKKPGALNRFLELDRELPHTLVLFETKYRIHKFLPVARDVLGDRRAAVCLEMTKKFQTVHRGFLSELAATFDGSGGKAKKGEITIVIAGNHPKFFANAATDDDDAAAGEST